MKRILFLMLCFTLLLSGCTWLDGEYHSVKPHASDGNKLSDDAVTVSDYIELRDALLEMVTISDTGPLGGLMNALSTCSFALVASCIYKKKHTIGGAILGLSVGSIVMAGIMVLWNWLITPLYMKVSREVVEGMLLPVFLPFNLVKAGLNSALTLALYKPLTSALRGSRLLPPSQGSKKIHPWVYVLAGLLLVTFILLLLVLMEKI